MEKQQWLEQLTGQLAPAQQQADENAKKKQAILAQLWTDVSSMAEQQRENLDIKLKSGKKKQKVLDFDNRDQTKEFDLDEIQDGFEIRSEDDLKKLTSALNTTEEWVQKLKKLNFTDEEIAAELYQPLVRRGMLPETFVPDDLSETREMIDHTFDAYKGRLKAEEKSEVAQFFNENLSLIMASGGAVTSLGGLGANIDRLQQGLKQDDLKNIVGQSSFKPSDMQTNFIQSWTDNLTKNQFGGYERSAGQVANIFNLANMGTNVIGAGVEGVKDIVNKVDDTNARKEPGAARLANLANLAKDFVACLTSQLFAVFNTSGLGMVASSAFGAVLKPQAVALALKGVDEGKPKRNVLKEADVVKAIAHLSTALEAGMTACAKHTAGDVKNRLEVAGGAMKTAFETNCKSADLLDALQEDDGKFDPSKAIALVSKAGQQAVAAVKPELDILLRDPNTVDQVRGGMDEKMAEELRKELDARDLQAAQEKKEFQQMVDQGDTAKLISFVEKKTIEMKRDAQIVKWASTLGQMGFAQLAMAVGPAAIFGSSIKIVQNLIELAKRCQDCRNFITSQQHMFNAASHYAPVVANFISNSTMQALHYGFTVATEAANIVAAALQCSGVLAAAGVGLQAAVGATQAIETLILEAKKRYNLERAWTQYKLSLSRPANRKLALIAMKQNPTLAKYAIAYGAVIKGDPLVSDFVSYLGLTEQDIKDPRAKLDKVVAYMEARLPDDITVVGRVVDLHDWAPEPIELTLACWVSAKKRGETKANLKKGDSTAIETALARFGAVFDDAKQKHTTAPADDDTKAAVQGCLDVLDDVDKALHAYHPRMDQDGKEMDHGQMQNLVKEFLKQSAARRGDLQ